MSVKEHKNSVTGQDPVLWLQQYGDDLYRYALQRLGNTAQAEDVVQETLLAALQARAGYAGHSSEKTWLIGILKHKITDLFRIQFRESTVEDINALSDAATENGTNEIFNARGRWIHAPRDWGNPDTAVYNQQLVAAFEYCIEHLKPAHAQVFSLKELAGLSTEDICSELEITATNCSVMLYRARMGLRRCLELRLADNHPGRP